MDDWLRVAGGGALLYLGAEWFIGGATALALALRVSQLMVGLTVVAYGTSAPEIIVGVEAAGAGHGSVALGNVIGSSIANLGLILGCAALIRPARVDASLRRRELPMLLVSTALIPLSLLDGEVSHLEGATLMQLFLGGAIALASLGLDLCALLGVTLLAALLMRSEREVSRSEGSLLLAFYIAFIGITLGG